MAPCVVLDLENDGCIELMDGTGADCSNVLADCCSEVVCFAFVAWEVVMDWIAVAVVIRDVVCCGAVMDWIGVCVAAIGVAL